MPASTRTPTRRVASSISGSPSPIRESAFTTDGYLGAVPNVHLDDVAADAALELTRRAGRHGPAVIDDHDAAGQVIGLVQVLRRQQDVGAAFHHGADGVPQLDPAARVQPGRRLVQQQQPRGAHQARAQVELAAHAARVRPHQAVAVSGQPELLEHPRAVVAGLATLAAEQPGHHLQVLPAGERRLDRRELSR